MMDLAFDVATAERANDEWGFNCGPAALAVVLGLTPDVVKAFLGDFRGYMNPTQMYATLRSVGATWRIVDLGDVHKLEATGTRFPRFGIARIQWGGPWMKPRVPIPARYRKTHWVASYQERGQKTKIYDINAGDWVTLAKWVKEIVPKILVDIPRADGSWWITHAIEVTR